MRWIGRIILAVIACILVALLLVFMLPADRIGQIASDQLERRTGRSLTLSGDFRPTFWPVLGARTGPISISNPDWATNPQMLTAQGAAVGIDLGALLGGAIRVETLHLTDPVIWLERAADGRVNWTFAAPDADAEGATDAATPDAPPPDAGSGSAGFSLESGRITGGRILFSDALTGTRHQISELTADLSLPAATPAATLALAATIDGVEMTAEAQLDDRHAVFAGDRTQVSARLAALGSGARYDGSAGLTDGFPDLEGSFALDSSTPAPLASLVGVSLPQPLARLRALRLAGDLILTRRQLFLAADLGGKLGDSPLTGRATLAGAAGWMTLAGFDADLTLAAEDMADLAFNGRLALGDGPLVDGTLRARALQLAPTLALAGIPAEPPVQSLSAEGRFTLQPTGEMALRKGQYRADRSALTGDVTLRPGDVPRLTADLSAGALDLAPFLTEPGQTAAPGAGGKAAEPGWSSAEIRLAGLDTLDADVTLRAQSVDLGRSRLGRTDIAATLSDGRLGLTLHRVEAFGGILAGTAELRGADGLAFTSDLTATDMQLEPLLGTLAGFSRLTGTGTTRLRLSGAGRSMRALMASLSGSGAVDLGQGTIKGIDLAAMMRNLRAAFGGFEGATEFSSLSATFDMDSGILSNVDLSLVSPLFRAGGKGSVDIGGRTMNYEITPGRFREGSEIAVPVMITGPWHDLKFRPDLEKLADLLVGGKFLDDAEKTAAREKLAEVRALLDDPGAAVEDRLKERIAEKLQREFNLGDSGSSAESQGRNAGETSDRASDRASGQTSEPADLEDRLKAGLAARLREELGLPAPPPPAARPAPGAQGGSALALSTPGRRPRLRPAGLRTDTALPPPPPAPGTTPPPSPQPDTRSTEERIRDELEDAAKNELKKLFRLGD